MLEILAKLLPFIAPSPTAIKGVINVDELKRVLLTSLATGLIAAAIGVVTAVQDDLSNIVTLPLLAGPVMTALTMALDAIRRLYHGSNFA
jgi:hypothetical protein